MPERVLTPTNETAMRMLAIRQFVDWLYEEAPDIASMPREKLIDRYWNRVATEALVSEAMLSVQSPIRLLPRNDPS